jgi:chromosome segregation ATPase
MDMRACVFFFVPLFLFSGCTVSPEESQKTIGELKSQLEGDQNRISELESRLETVHSEFVDVMSSYRESRSALQALQKEIRDSGRESLGHKLQGIEAAALNIESTLDELDSALREVDSNL